MTPITEALRLRQAELTAKAALEWPALVAACLDGTPDPDKLLAALERSGRSAEELDRAMGLLAQRRVWAAALPQADTATKDLAGAMSKLEALESEFAKLLAAHAAKVAPLRRDISGMRSVVEAGDVARQELRRTVGAELADQMEVNVQRTHALATARNGAERAVEAGLANVDRWRASTSPRAEAELATREAQLTDLRASLDDIAKAETELEAKRLMLVAQTLLP